MKNLDNIKILLIGTGAVGSFYSAGLSRAGASVSVVARSDYNTVKEKGILIKSSGKDYIFKPDNVYSTPAECDFEPDYLIVATKVLPEIDVPRLIQDCVGKNTSIMLLQNGIDIESSVAHSFPYNEVISALAFICVSRPQYGIIDHQGLGRIVVGTYPSGVSDKAKLISDIFNYSGIKCNVSGDVAASRWKKLLWNAPFNPLSVIAGGIDTRTMLENTLMRNLVKNVMTEVVMLSKADSHPLSDEMIKQTIEDTLKMKPYKTSMLLDFENRRSMEVDAILGNAVKIAAKYSVDTPCLNSLHALLSMINENNLTKD